MQAYCFWGNPLPNALPLVITNKWGLEGAAFATVWMRFKKPKTNWK
jgi:hypothetical protein